MIKSLIISIFLTVSVFAISGQSVYDNKCASYHSIKGMLKYVTAIVKNQKFHQVNVAEIQRELKNNGIYLRIF